MSGSEKLTARVWSMDAMIIKIYFNFNHQYWLIATEAYKICKPNKLLVCKVLQLKTICFHFSHRSLCSMVFLHCLHCHFSYSKLCFEYHRASLFVLNTKNTWDFMHLSPAYSLSDIYFNYYFKWVPYTGQREETHTTTPSHRIEWLYTYTVTWYIQGHLFTCQWCPPSLVNQEAFSANWPLTDA
jgi:hypothetical protein